MAATAGTAHPLADRQDPGQTQRIRSRFASRMNNRWRMVRGALRETIDRADALGVEETTDQRRRVGDPTQKLRPHDFGASTPAEQVAAFSDWVGYLLTYRIREQLPSAARRRGKHYTAAFLRQGYARGIRAAGIELRRAGVDAPRVKPSAVLTERHHTTLLARVFADTYHDVQVVADATERDLVRTASELLRGEAIGMSAQLADRLRDRVEAVGEARSELIATARVTDALTTAVLERYRRAGIRRVRLIGGVSDRAVEAEVFALDDIRRGMADAPRPPLHPRDTRLLVPVV